VSWSDAQSYVAWLNKMAGAPVYRLLTEAEWEYLARAGSTTPYPTGTRITRAAANFGSGRSDPVGSYAANSFGFYDLMGNAAEWVADCYGAGFAGAATDGSAVDSPRCAMRVYRGGGYKDAASALRSANRRRAAPGARDASIGFRVAREVN
jgi:formylglycine-generating enzyme required for sulfatase activity